MAQVRVNPPPTPKPTSVEVFTGPKNDPEQDAIVVSPRGSRPQVNGFEIAYVRNRMTPRSESSVFVLVGEDFITFVEGVAALAGLEVVDPS